MGCPMLKQRPVIHLEPSDPRGSLLLAPAPVDGVLFGGMAVPMPMPTIHVTRPRDGGLRQLSREEPVGRVGPRSSALASQLVKVART